MLFNYLKFLALMSSVEDPKKGTQENAGIINSLMTDELKHIYLIYLSTAHLFSVLKLVLL